MEKFSLSERYRLEIHWDDTVYEQEGLCKFKNARFTGPALYQAQKINENDHIMLDFFQQYYVIVSEIYVARFSWEKVIYNKDGSISVGQAYLSHDTMLNKVPTLSKKDCLVIDTANHETEAHQYNLTYKTYVVNEDASLYKF